jgi:hypothetical protein
MDTQSLAPEIDAVNVSVGVYAKSADGGNLTTAEVSAATLTGAATGTPALIPYSGPGVRSGPTTAVS